MKAREEKVMEVESLDMEQGIDILQSLTDPQFLVRLLSDVQEWLLTDVLVLSNLMQILVIAFCYFIARLLAPPVSRGLEFLGQRGPFEDRAREAARIVIPLALPFIWLALQWLSVLIAERSSWPGNFIEIAVSLLTAWVIIRFASQFVRDVAWSKTIATLVWGLAALNILGWFDDAIGILDAAAVEVGDAHISVLTVIKGFVSLALLLWAANIVSRLFERQVGTYSNLTPRVRVLFSKLVKIVLVTIAIVAAITAVGIDLTAFAVLGGAIGVGIGFGLQKAVSNLISGVMLLMDRSIKPGEVVSIGGTYGWVSQLGARYVSVVTRDGIEHLVPNENFITQGVENWSFSDSNVRLKIPIGISYKSDVRKAIALCIDSAHAVPRVIKNPEPACLLKGFGNSSVDLELRLWISDPSNGISNVKSQVLLGVWDRFHEHGVEIPFPQRDVHIRSTVPHPEAVPNTIQAT